MLDLKTALWAAGVEVKSSPYDAKNFGLPVLGKGVIQIFKMAVNHTQSAPDLKKCKKQFRLRVNHYDLYVSLHKATKKGHIEVKVSDRDRYAMHEEMESLGFEDIGTSTYNFKFRVNPAAITTRDQIKSFMKLLLFPEDQDLEKIYNNLKKSG